MNNLKTAYLNPAADYNLGYLKWSMFLSIFTSLAIFLPYICHQFGIAGKVFLPMHFAVLIAAVVMGLKGGFSVALISPALSFLISGMPPSALLLPMTIELATYAVVLNLFYRSLKSPLILSLAVSMLCGRAVSIIFMGAFLHNAPVSTLLYNMFVVGIPGMLIQLAFVPLISLKAKDFLKNE